MHVVRHYNVLRRLGRAKFGKLSITEIYLITTPLEFYLELISVAFNILLLLQSVLLDVFAGYVVFAGNAVFDGYVVFAGNAVFDGYVVFAGYTVFAGYAVFDGFCSVSPLILFFFLAVAIHLAGYAVIASYAIFAGFAAVLLVLLVMLIFVILLVFLFCCF